MGEFLDYLPANELMVVEELRTLIFDCIPDVQEKLSYNVPFYRLKRNICFIWPSTIPWGNVAKGGVALGFTRGDQLNNDMGWLDTGKHKFVRSRTFFNADEIDTEKVRFYLYEALDVDGD